MTDEAEALSEGVLARLRGLLASSLVAGLPWEVRTDGDLVALCGTGGEDSGGGWVMDHGDSRRDRVEADLIVAAINALPGLLATLDQRTRERDEARADLSEHLDPKSLDRIQTIRNQRYELRQQHRRCNDLRARVKELEAELTTYREIVELVAADGLVVGEVRDLLDLDYPNLREAIERCYDIRRW